MAIFDTAKPINGLKPGQKIYFASDFHLGSPNREESLKRELRIVQWLEQIKSDASAIFFVGDVFDFWFEYKEVVPKGFIRFQGKLAELSDSGIPLFLFAGNHDLWFSNYLTNELGIKIFGGPIQIDINEKRFLIGHGDGLGKGDYFYKALKKVFTASFAKWIFRLLHPDIGVKVALFWSNSSKERSKKKDETFKGDNEVLFKYCRELEQREHHDFYVFGHRHMPLEMELSESSTYFNLGEWMHSNTYLEFDGEKATLLHFNS